MRYRILELDNGNYIVQKLYTRIIFSFIKIRKWETFYGFGDGRSYDECRNAIQEEIDYYEKMKKREKDRKVKKIVEEIE